MARASQLAIHGGPKVRTRPFPYRKLFGEAELAAVVRVFKDAWRRKRDFGYQEGCEARYTDAFCQFQGGGYADAVSSGSAGIYLSLAALEIPPGSEVIVSPVTDPGGLYPVVIAGLRPVVADAKPHSFNLAPEAFARAITPQTRAAVLTHLGGHPMDMAPIMEIAQAHGVRVIEDCSQAHGASYHGTKVGCFGEVGVFSTMYRKMHATGGCGGLVYTRDRELYWRLRSWADRGKPFHDASFDLSAPYNPWAFQFPALNFNNDEISCAIGLSTLSRLPATIAARGRIADQIDAGLSQSKVVSPCACQPGCVPSLYYHTVKVNVARLKVPKREFAEAIAAEGVWINPDYRNVVAEWPSLKPYLGGRKTPNATRFRQQSFNILFNERFTRTDVADIIQCILKVERQLAK
jgi:perosamine synthetase